MTAKLQRISLLMLAVLLPFLGHAEVPQKEKKALVELYNSTKGSQWLISWDLKAPVSSWKGITVENDHVTQINLFRNNLEGALRRLGN